MQEILESSKEGLTKQQMLDRLGLSYQQLREITAELLTRNFFDTLSQMRLKSLHIGGLDSFRQQKENNHT